MLTEDRSVLAVLETASDRETFELGKDFGSKAQPGQVYSLIWDLGAGKTVFTGTIPVDACRKICAVFF